MKECKHTHRCTRTHSHTQTKHLYMSYARYCYHFCYSVWQQLFETRECLCFLGAKTLLLCLALWTHRTSYCLYQTEEPVTHLSPSSYALSLSPLWSHLNILVLSEEVHREEQKEKSTVNATHDISETLFSLFLLLTAHASVSCLFIRSHPSQYSRWTLHIILCDAKQDHNEWWVQMGVFWWRRVSGQVL